MRTNKIKNIEIFIFAAAAAVFFMWFFKDALFKGQIFVERDLSRYYYPLRFFTVNCVKSGIFPLWNPYIFCGNPLFASLQSCVLYPLSFIYYIGDFTRAFNIFIVAHYFLAAFFTYIFLRQMRCSFFAAALSGFLFALSGYMTSVVNLLTTLSAVTWFPLAMLFYYKLIKSAAGNGNRFETCPHCFRYVVFLGVVFTIMFLGGEPSILYIVMGLFFCGAVYFTIEEFLEKKRFNFAYIGGMLLAAVVFLGLSAFQFLPFWEFLKTTSRNSPNFEMSTIWSLPVKDLPGMVLPFFHDIYKLFVSYWQRQSWLDNYYVGALAFIFFLTAIFFDKSKKTKAIFIFGLLGFVLSLGKDTALFEFLYRIVPGFKFMRYSVRFFFIPTFAISVLAGIGIDYYAGFIKSDPRLKKTAFFMLSAAFFASIAFLIVDARFDSCLDFIREIAVKVLFGLNMSKTYIEEAVKLPVFSEFISMDLINFRRALLLLAFFGTLFFLGSKNSARHKIFIIPALVFLAIIDVSSVNGGYSPVSDAKEFTSPSSNVGFLMKEAKSGLLFRICCSPQTARQHSYVPEPGFRKGLEASKDRLITDRMVEFGIYDVNMYGSVYNSRNVKFLNLIMGEKSENLEKLLALLNVKFVASSRQPELTGFKLVNQSQPANLYKAERFLERAFLVGNPIVIKDEYEILKRLSEGDFDPANDVILEDNENLGDRFILMPTPQHKPVPTDKAEITSYAPNKIIIEANVSGSPKFLVLSDTYYPGWKAIVDGKYQKIIRADYILRAVYLAPGSHHVEFIYSPMSFKLGIIISLLTLLIILTSVVYYNIIIK
ncbi:MAG: hypothetical protein COW11_01885 [Candidatus Omnitrophica bacterium CG12_big_fil_rev_8_21_14_0_65_43_15]|uniref:Membrane protein 6-pyruvoyl-tetrahydropterin synthase-related domain-containing protein n=1 Tax=Candidatus Taenaricola geysiri TaxID=1974752 RepID=A0A2J0LFV5_9BACT|nr:MAG: hypothetical protein COW11_01885 [Candidatus Omnitrophica bacterium CG12_big_fil_rev_8_21_14_0_65_43_15]